MLIRLEANGFKVVAYADDVIVFIEGSSRRQLETKEQKATDIILLWCKEQSVQLSKTKTEIIMLKDAGQGNQAGGAKTQAGTGTKSLVRTGKGGKRPPVIKIENKSIKYADKVKYLGVTLGTRMKITAHIENVGAKAKRIFSSLGTLVKPDWGLP